MTTEMTPPSIHEALSAVMDAVGAVGKDGRNTQQNFSFRGIDAVVNAVGPAFRRHGVVALPIVEDAQYDQITTRSGALMRQCTLRIRWRFVGPAGDALEAVVMSESMDAGDKATAKAHSVSYRTALLQVLCIPTDDPDPDASSYERGAAPVGRSVTAAKIELVGLLGGDKDAAAAIWQAGPCAGLSAEDPVSDADWAALQAAAAATNEGAEA